MADNLRYAIIGAQNWAIGSEHVRSVVGTPGIELTAVCNNDPEELEKLKGFVPEGTALVDDADTLFASTKLDAVVISTPNHTHQELAEKAFSAGLHVLCEKPLAPTVAGCDAIIAARDRSGKLLQVGMHRRYNRLFLRLEQLVAGGELGRPVLMWSQEFRGDWKILPPQRPNWRYSNELSGGSLVEKNVHDFDVFNWFAGAPPVRVMASGGLVAYEGRETIDHALVIVEYANGFEADLQLSLFTPHGFPGRYGGLVGDKGSVRIHERARELYQYYRGRSDEVRLTVSDPHSGHGHGVRAEHVEFARCIRANEAPAASGEAGRLAVAVGAAGEESIRTGEPVPVEV